MDQTSPFEMMLLALEYILFAAFLVVFVQTINIRNRFAETRTGQVASIEAIKQFREFNQYENGVCIGVDCLNHLYGDEVIELIRRYYDSMDIEIYIDKTSNNGSQMVVNADLSSGNPEAYAVETLQALIYSKSEFHSYLVYDGITPSKYTTYQQNHLGTVTGIALFWKKDN